MNDLMVLALAAAGGAVLGMMFYGGLYWTIRRGIESKSPALWFSASLLLRTALALIGFYAISGGDWRRLLACVPGFLLARVVVTWWGYRSAVRSQPLKAAEAP
jgi:F1F0 ATPase subunit 2